jgi:uncharacterized membrane protein
MSDSSPQQPSSSRPSRNLGIDLARGLAVVLMIQTHALDGWVTTANKAEWPYRLTRLFANIPAPLFLLLAGLSVGMQTLSIQRSGQDPATLRKQLSMRALEVIGYGYLVSFFYAIIDGHLQPATLFRADILHCIGLSLLLCTQLFVGRSHLTVRVLLLALVSVGLGLLSRLLPPLPLPLATLLGLLVDVVPITRFPLFPLCTFVAIGLWLGSTQRPTDWTQSKILLVLLGMLGLTLIAKELTSLTLTMLGGKLSRAHPAVIWNLLEGTALSLSVLSLSLYLALRLPASLYGFLLRLGRGSLFAYAVHIPLCYSRLAQPVQGKLPMKSALPLLLGLIALTWLAVWLKDAVQLRLRNTKATAVTTVALLILASATASAEPQVQKDSVQHSESAALAHELAAAGRFSLAYALNPIDGYRAQVTLPDDFSIKAEVERSHLLFQSGQFRESADSYSLLLVARPDLTRVLFNIAQGLRRAGDDRFALGFYRRYLQVDPSTPLRAEVEGYIRELASLSLARTQAQNHPPTPTPIHKRAWFWVTLTAGVAVVAAVVGLGITLGTQTQPTTPPDEYLGPFDVMFPRPTR